MKKTILLFAAVVLVKLSVAQWSTSGTSVYTTNNSARVGIGAGSTLNAELEVKRDQASATMTRVRNLSSSAGAIARFQLDSYTTNSSQYSDLVQNSGSPYRFWVGSAVTNVYFDGPNSPGTIQPAPPPGTLTNTGSMGIGTATTGSFKLAVEEPSGAEISYFHLLAICIQTRLSLASSAILKLYTHSPSSARHSIGRRR